ncbi:MAG: hypothetical protein JWO82_2756 [Akkermansiaceae bacterium]|nr:hypothetical protein [Akkermansiaceae bacterium]
MLASRSKRERRDRDSGLVFSWRLPVGNGMTIFTSVVLVGLMAAALSSAIRIHVEGNARQPERRGAFVMLESGSPELKILERIALEAGPFPVRAHPSQDPAVKGQLQSAVTGWMPAGTEYHPAWQNVPAEIRWSREKAAPAVVLPPLPDPESSVQPATPATPPLRANSLASGVSITPESPVPAGIAAGTRFMVSYDATGQIDRVSALKPDERSGAGVADLWLIGARVEGGGPDGGWLAMEVGP